MATSTVMIFDTDFMDALAAAVLAAPTTGGVTVQQRLEHLDANVSSVSGGGSTPAYGGSIR